MLAMKFSRILLYVFAALAHVSPSNAETVRIAGLYPAGDPDVAGIKSISITMFNGEEGLALSQEIESQLASVILNNEQYFIIKDLSGGRSDSTLTGSVRVNVEPSLVKQSRRICVFENQKGKCLQYETKLFNCDRRVIVFNAIARLTKTANKQIVYSSTKSDKRDFIECPDDAVSESTEEAISVMIKAAASAIRYDVAPTYREERVRLIEDNEGMDKQVAKSFKEAIKLTKKNEDRACDAMRALRVSSQDQISILYNIALCDEKQNKFAEATALYRQIQPMFPNKDFINAGLSRIAARQRAQAEWEKRSAPIRKAK